MKQKRVRSNDNFCRLHEKSTTDENSKNRIIHEDAIRRLYIEKACADAAGRIIILQDLEESVINIED